MNVLNIELVREVGREKTYKIVYQETETFTTRLVGKTFNYDYDEIKMIPESVLDFAEKWILGNI